MKRYRIKLGTLWVIGSLLLGVIVMVAPASAAATLACGTKIMKSTTLQADVGPCPRDGLVIGADNITLNLNGHRIFGTDGTAADDSSATAGIRLPMRKGVVITGAMQPGSSVEGFDAGVFVNGGSGNTIQGLYIHDNMGSPNINAALLGDGIALFNSSGNRIFNNRLVRNGWYDNVAVLGPAANDNTVQGNTMTDSPAMGRGSGYGIVVDAYLDAPTGKVIHGNNVVDNTVQNNGGSGISNVNTTNATVARNTVTGNRLHGIGASLGLQPETRVGNMTIEDNLSSNNGQFGFDIRSDGNTIRRNTSTQNRQGMIVWFGTTGNQITTNKLQRNGTVFYDVQIYLLGGGNLVQSNTVTDSIGGGIVSELADPPDAEHPGNRIISNFSVNNDSSGSGYYADLADMAWNWPDCDSFWFDNTYVTAYPECTTNGGHQVAAGTPPPPGSRTGAPGQSATAATVRSSDGDPAAIVRRSR